MTRFYLTQPVGMFFYRNWAYCLDKVEIYGPWHEGCPVFGGRIFGRQWLLPHEIEISRSLPKWWGDVLWGTTLCFMVSSHFIEMYTKENLTGIEKIHAPATIVRLGTKKPQQMQIPLPVYSAIDIS